MLLKSVLWIFWDYMKGVGVGIACRTKAKDKVLHYWLKMAYNKRLKDRISENKHVNVSRALNPVFSYPNTSHLQLIDTIAIQQT